MTKRIPLYDFSLGRNFVIGEPLNGQDIPHEGLAAQCRCEDYDYSGADSAIQFPEKWHVGAGIGGLAGGFHQSCEGEDFQPWRLQVIPDEKKRRNLMHLDGSGLAKVYVSKWFDKDIWHPEASANSTGEGLLSEFVFRVSGGEPYEWGFELRGELNVAVYKNESVECMGVHFRYGKLIVLYWKDAVDGSRIEDHRVKNEFDVPLAPNVWHRLLLKMAPMGTRAEWATDISLRRVQTPIFSFRTERGTHANNIDRITQIGFGKEQERQETIGTMEVARAMCWETQ